MAISLKAVRELLERDARGELSNEEQATLQQNARTLRRRLDRVRALYPELELSLSEQLDELARPPVLTASG